MIYLFLTIKIILEISFSRVNGGQIKISLPETSSKFLLSSLINVTPSFKVLFIFQFATINAMISPVLLYLLKYLFVY